MKYTKVKFLALLLLFDILSVLIQQCMKHKFMQRCFLFFKVFFSMNFLFEMLHFLQSEIVRIAYEHSYKCKRFFVMVCWCHAIFLSFYLQARTCIVFAFLSILLILRKLETWCGSSWYLTIIKCDHNIRIGRKTFHRNLLCICFLSRTLRKCVLGIKMT